MSDYACIMLRKSSLQDYVRCPRLYKLRWIDGLKGEETFEGEIGRLFHQWAAETMMKYDPPLPKTLADDIGIAELREMCRWFIHLENKRWERLRALGKEQYWKPRKVEWEVHATLRIDDFEVEAWGHIDRLDEDEDGYVLIEYKTTRGRHLTDWRRELMFYRFILQEIGYDVTMFVVINPMLREYYVERPNTYTEVALKRLIHRIVRDREFKPRRGPHCAFCPLRRVCLGL